MDDIMYKDERARFAARLFLFVAGMPRGARRLFNRFLFKEAKEMADSRDALCRQALIAQLYNYFDAEVVTNFLFPASGKAALVAYITMPFADFYEQFCPAMDIEWSNKTYDTFDSLTIFDANPEALNELNIADYQTLFALAQERSAGNEPQDFSQIGYLSFFYKSELTDDDYAMVNRLYCQGELLYDLFDFVCSEELTTAVRKRAVDALTDYCEDCGDDVFVRRTLELAQNYQKMNPSKQLPVDLVSCVDGEPQQAVGEVRLLPKSCLHGCDRDRFIAALERVLVREGMIEPGGGRLESLFEGTKESPQPVTWKLKSYEFAYFLRELCPFLKYKEEIAARLFYYRVPGVWFKVSSLRSPRCSDGEVVKKRMEKIVAEVVAEAAVG